MTELMIEVSNILRAEYIPTPNAKKTFSLALWIFASHALPTPAIARAKRYMIWAMRQIISVDASRDFSELNLVDSLKARIHIVFPSISSELSCC